MKNMSKWFLLLNKRLYKKLTFILIMLLIPVLAFGYGFLAKEDSGVMTIALSQEGNDPLASQIIADLKRDTNLINFVLCDTSEAAKKMINDGKADAAWIFADDLENQIYRFVRRPSRSTAFVEIVEQESTIPMKLAREKLSGSVFSHCSRAFYLTYIRKNVPEMREVPDADILRYYDEFTMDVNLFEFAYLEGEGGAEDAENANYLLTPVRGLLAVVIVLGGLAAAMYYVHDDHCGTYSLVPHGKRCLVEFACQMIAVANLSLVVLLSLRFTGLTVDLGREVLLSLLYAVMTALFCMAVRRILSSISAIGTALSLLVVVMLVLCPVFFDLGRLRSFQYLLPPTYYINAVRSDRFMLLMIAYSMICAAIYFLSGKLLKRK